MELSSEDALRLNVLAAQAEAVRIDEGRMTVFGLAGGRELKVTLNPSGRADGYLRRVRELLAGVALDSPGGYPVFLKRWTRMGEVDHDRLAQLLRLGEPEAVMAVACSPRLDDALAARVWWCQPDAEIARRMLERPAVTGGEMGPVLARFLLEFLPFEAEPFDMVESVRLVLQPGLIDEEQARQLWSAGKRKGGYRVGFLITRPDALPEGAAPHPRLAALRQALAGPAGEDNAPAALLLKLHDAPGQGFLRACVDTLDRLTHQDVTSAMMNAVGAYFAAARQSDERFEEIDGLIAAAPGWLDGAEPASPLGRLREAVPQWRGEIAAMLVLAHVSEHLLTAVFARTDAVGSVLRRKLEPVTAPLLGQLGLLLGEKGG